MKKALLCVILLFLFANIYAQQTIVILRKDIGKSQLSTVYGSPTLDDSIHLKIPSYIKYRFYQGYHFYNYSLEESFRRYKSKQISYDKFVQFRNTYYRNVYVDTLQLLKTLKNYPSSVKTYIVSGRDDNNNQIILIDINRDGNITPDEVFKFSEQDIKNIKNNPDTLKNYKNIAFTQQGKDGAVRSFNLKIKPGPYYSSYPDEKQKLTDLGFIRNEYWYGSVKLGPDTLGIFAEPQRFTYEIPSDLEFVAQMDGFTDKRNRFDLKEEWANAKYSLTVDSVIKIDDETAKLFITYQSPPKKHNDTTFSMAITNVNTNKQESLAQYLHHNKYILIDYWGTWCGPCIEKIPALKDLSLKYGSKLSLISIAYDFDINTVNKFDIDNNILWNSYFIDRKMSNNLTKPLKVTNYPTFRLYDDKGNLLAEGNTTDDLNRITQQVAKLL